METNAAGADGERETTHQNRIEMMTLSTTSMPSSPT